MIGFTIYLLKNYFISLGNKKLKSKFELALLKCHLIKSDICSHVLREIPMKTNHKSINFETFLKSN